MKNKLFYRNVTALWSSVSLLFVCCITLGSAHVFAQYSDIESIILSRLPRAQACQYYLAKRLGWQPVMNHGHTQFTGYQSCYYSSLPDAQRDGQLNIGLPDPNNPYEVDQFAANLGYHLQTADSLCGFKLQVARAAERVGYRLPMNSRFTFESRGPGYTSFPRPEWQTAPCGDCQVATSSASAALGSLYERSCSAECAVGRQVAEMLVSYELFGSADFDRAFSPSEVIAGPWDHVQNFSRSFVYGAGSGYSLAPETHYQQGAAFFVGLDGFINNVYGERYLDTPHDRSENFVIISASQRAIDSLARNGGTHYYNRLNEQIWNWVMRGGSAGSARANQLLSDPFYEEIHVYVHPLGVMNFRQHLIRLMQVNPRTPYAIQINQGNLNTTIFERFKNFYFESCYYAS